MKRKPGFQRKRTLDEDQKKLLPVIVIPLIVIILMIVIVVADRGRQTDAPAESGAVSLQETLESQEQDQTEPEESTETAETETEAESQEEPAETDPEDPFATESLQHDTVPEILDLMQTYFQARAKADAETMNRIYGVGEVSAADLEAQAARLRSNSRYIQDFENVTTYMKNGVSADSWLVYAVADIRFYSVDTAAPMIMWCYVTKDGDGNYLITDNARLDPEITRFIDVENRSEEVRRLASDVNVRLKEALTSDADLNEVYGVLRDGSPVWRDENGETAAVQILDETESVDGAVTVGETGAEDGGASADGTATEETAAGGETTTDAAVTETSETETSPAAGTEAGGTAGTAAAGTETGGTEASGTAVANESESS